MLSARRTILHLDLDAFYCTVEEQRDPGLRGQPFAVGARPEERGVVASCSYAARRFGVRSAMPTSQALRSCPSLLIVPTRHAVYREVSRQVMARLHALTPQVEQLSIDEAFLDVTGLVTPNQEVTTARLLAHRLQQQMQQELGLSCSLGVASNKMMAKIASDYGKSQVTDGRSPAAICVVPFGEEAAFLAPLPVSALWGVGPKTGAQLRALNLHTIGQLAQRSVQELVRRFGSHGYDLWQHARGIDNRDIQISRETKSISSETTFVEDVEEWDALAEVLREQAAEVASHLQRKKLQGNTIKIKVRWADFTTPTRQMTLPQATDQAGVIEEAALQLLRQLWLPPRPVRLLGVGVGGLTTVRQLSLWAEPAAEATALTLGADAIDADVLVGPHQNAQHLVVPDGVLLDPEPGAPAASIASGAFLGNGVSKHGVSKRQQVQRAIAKLQQRYGSDIIHLGLGQTRNQN
jgi:DNA polymerase-4